MDSSMPGMFCRPSGQPKGGGQPMGVRAYLRTSPAHNWVVRLRHLLIASGWMCTHAYGITWTRGDAPEILIQLPKASEYRFLSEKHRATIRGEEHFSRIRMGRSTA